MNVDMISCRTPINEDEARGIVEAESDPIARELMRMALGVAGMRFLKIRGMSDEDFERDLPESPFDMAFFAKVMKAFLSQRSTIEGILKGESVAKASGWDEG
jgi:hypothetical protein